MQVFATSADPLDCALSLDDKRLNKMITESAQIICTVLADDGVEDLPFKPTHETHPIVRWAGATDQNLLWLYQHHYQLQNEWRWRFGKKHGSALPEDIVSHIRNTRQLVEFHNGAKNKLRNLDFTWIPDVHTAYRVYLCERWRTDTLKPKWTKRNQPDWYDNFLFEDHLVGMLFINRAKMLIGSANERSIDCPKCGEKLEFQNKNDFHCTNKNPCISWEEIKK